MKKRKKFQGVLNILSFNRHFYITGLLVLAVLIVSNLFLPWSRLTFILIIGAFGYGFIMPLIVSAYVYDFSGYYNFDWLNHLIPPGQKMNLVVNINAGFDETSFLIKQRFPHVELDVFDFYDPGKHTEPAITRARKVSLTYPNTRQISTNAIPEELGSVDIVFLLSSAHEIRSNSEKIEFLKECFRICKPGGKVIMVEHLRDFPNFLAFTVGFTHFFSGKTWSKAFKTAGFKTFNETKFTPFMSVFHATTSTIAKT